MKAPNPMTVRHQRVMFHTTTAARNGPTMSQRQKRDTERARYHNGG